MSDYLNPDMRKQLYTQANGQCQCTMSLCSHHRAGERCPYALGEGWQAHQITAGGGYVLRDSNKTR